MDGRAVIGRAALALVLLAFGPACAEEHEREICSGEHSAQATEDHIECTSFLQGFEAANHWRCKVVDWSDYLQTKIPQPMWQDMGGLIRIVEHTSDAFCDKGYSTN